MSGNMYSLYICVYMYARDNLDFSIVFIIEKCQGKHRALSEDQTWDLYHLEDSHSHAPEIPATRPLLLTHSTRK